MDYEDKLIRDRKLAIQSVDNINLKDLKTSLYAIDADLHSKYTTETFDKGFYSGFGSLPTMAYSKYNLFESFRPQLASLKHEIKTLFERELKTEDKQHYICAWFNIYQPGKGATWHLHVDPTKKTYHGVFCVQSNEPSATIYRKLKSNKQYNCLDHKPPNCITIKNEPCNFDTFATDEYEEYKIDSKDGLLFIAECDGAMHCSTLNIGPEPRITIAFDIAYDITQTDPPDMIWLPL